MEVIITHKAMDFDGLSSMLLAKKIFPEALPLYSSGLSKPIRHILSLFKDVLEVYSPKYINKKDKIDRIIVVDSKRPERLEYLQRFLLQNFPEIIVFDHHPLTDKDLDAALCVFGNYGANTTLMWRYCKKLGIKLTPIESTLALLGIYADTGNLSFPSTRPEDAEAVADFLRMGADIKFVVSFLKPIYPEDLRELFTTLSTMQPERIKEKDYNIVIYKKILRKDVRNIQLLLQDLSELEGADAIVGIFKEESSDEVYIFLQSAVDEIECNKIAGNFGGGGHNAIASAHTRIYNIDYVLDEVKRQLISMLNEKLSLVTDIMTENVYVIEDESIILEEIQKKFKAEKIHGAPVIINGKLKGILSMRDIMKAEKNNLLHAPVKAFMTKNVATISTKAQIFEAQKIILEKDIGHLPIVNEAKEIVGIISRKDILEYTFNKNK